jgi:hypothetical protein
MSAVNMTTAGSAPCIRAEIDRPVILPDGEAYPPGTLRLCLDREYSPVSGLHLTSMGGRTAGLFVSRDTLSEGEAQNGMDALMIFRRVYGGSLFLAGYAVPYKDRIRVYWMEQAGTSRMTAKAIPEGLGLFSASPAGTEEFEIIAASLR